MSLHQRQAAAIVTGPPAYERYFVPAIGRPLAEDLIAVADLRPGEHVLDIACGTGVVTRLAVERVGPSGAVFGVDINPGMIAAARQALADVPEISWHVADAESLPLPGDSVDVVLCQMGLQFVPGKLAALREMRRVLRPGGRALVSVPGPQPDMFAILSEALAQHIDPETAKFCDVVFAMYDCDEIRELLRSAGFKDPSANSQPILLRLPPPADFLWQYIQSTPIASAVLAKERDVLERLEKDVSTAWRRYETSGGMDLEIGMTTAGARK